MFVQYNAFYMDGFTITVTNVRSTGSPGKQYGNCIPVLVKGSTDGRRRSRSDWKATVLGFEVFDMRREDFSI